MVSYHSGSSYDGSYIYDRQHYKTKFAQFSDVISTEISAGFKIFFTDNFGLNCGIGTQISLYGSQFSKLKMEKIGSDNDSNLIPLNNQDLENKDIFNKKDFIQPPMYFFELGFVYQI
jgi:hypothetical protein